MKYPVSFHISQLYHKCPFISGLFEAISKQSYTLRLVDILSLYRNIPYFFFPPLGIYLLKKQIICPEEFSHILDLADSCSGVI